MTTTAASNKSGRDSNLTASEIRLILRDIEAGFTIETICRQNRVSSNTVSQVRKGVWTRYEDGAPVDSRIRNLTK